MKTLVVIVDGMRPDALVKTKNAKYLLENSKYTLNAKTVTPSVTLPCHMSLFHSVDPSRQEKPQLNFQLRFFSSICYASFIEQTQ